MVPELEEQSYDEIQEEKKESRYIRVDIEHRNYDDLWPLDKVIARIFYWTAFYGHLELI